MSYYLLYQIQLEKYEKPKYGYNRKPVKSQKAFWEFRVKKIFHFNLLLSRKYRISNINSVKEKIIEKEMIKLKTFLYLIKTVTLKYLYHFYNVALNNNVV